ncbi:hypothetical protein BH11MYX1_BH11MYX1_31100 [soil metagenome]
MGRVYSAHHTRLHRRQFAIKVLLGDLAATMSTRIRFAQEADAASRLDHPNVVPVVDFGKTHTGLMFLAMELVTGPTLAQLIETEAPLSVDRVIGLTRQLCLGLAHAHACGLVHRDFKPDNVVVVSGSGLEVPRILDFGLAITHDEPSARLTTAGMALGTPSYASPEQTHHEPVDERADLFALGVTMFEMLAGKLPYDGNAMEMIELNARNAPPPIASRAAVSVPPALEAIVVRLMARQPAHRFSSATDVIAALDTVHAIELIATPPSPIITKPARWPIVAAVVGSLVAISVVYAALLHHPTSPNPASAIVKPIETPRPVVTTLAPRSEPPPVAIPTPVPTSTTKPAPLRPVPRTTAKATQKPTQKAPQNPTQTPMTIAVAEPPVIADPPTSIEPSIETPTQVETVKEIPNQLPKAMPSFKLTSASLEAVTSHGSLSTSIVRRSVERAMADITGCARASAVSSKSATETVNATFVIDDQRHATSIATTSSSVLAGCVKRALASVRTADAPDVGTVSVSLEIRFTGGSS